jgi:high-affinity nickel permease
MERNDGVLIALTLGFLLGLKHATDADHVVAVSAIARDFGSAWRGIWVGIS